MVGAVEQLWVLGERSPTAERLAARWLPGSLTLVLPAARELLTNVAKHARASTVWVEVHRDGDRVLLSVRDDGSGFDPQQVGNSVAAGHIGLGSLLARFDAMGGAMHIESTAGSGTRITAVSPPEPPDEA